MGDFGKICLPQPYTTASFIFLVQWQIFQNFALRGRIRKSSNLDRTIGETNRIRTIANSVGFTDSSIQIGAFPNATPVSKILKNLPLDQKDERRRSVWLGQADFSKIAHHRIVNKNSSNMSAACLFKKTDTQYWKAFYQFT